MNAMDPRNVTIELAVVKRAKEGNRESLTLLLRHVSDTMFVYIYRLTLSRDLAEDLAQDATLHVLKQLNELSIDTLAGFWTWTYRAALGMVQHYYRKRSRESLVPLRDFDLDETVAYCAAGFDGIPERAMRKETIAGVLCTMDALKLEHRHMLILRCLNEMSYSQIAQILGGTELKSRWLFLRARRSLKRQLIDQGFEQEHLTTALGLFGFITGVSRKATRTISGPVAAETLQVVDAALAWRWLARNRRTAL